MQQLIVGDVHGDLDRLFQALRPYPATEWQTLFLGDLVDGGAFGAGALRYARDRPSSESVTLRSSVSRGNSVMIW